MSWVNHRPQSHREHQSIEGKITSSCSPNIKEVSVQEKYKNKRHRPCYDIRVNLCQRNIRRRRSRAVSRIPTTQIKRLLQNSEKVVIKVQKYVRKVVPQSSKLHVYLCKRSSAYYRFNNDWSRGEQWICFPRISMFPETKSIQFHYWNPDYLNVGEFQAMYWEMETVFSVQSHSSYIPTLSIICIYTLLEFSMFCITLSCI